MRAKIQLAAMDSNRQRFHKTDAIATFLVGVKLLLLATTALAADAGEMMTLDVDDDELTLLRFEAEGQHLIIWISPGFGNLDRAHAVARAISQRGIEVWHIDIAESLFLPPGTSTLRDLDGRNVASLIQQAHQSTGKMITLMARSYAALPALRGARLWQLQTSSQNRKADYLTGAIVFSPELYSEIPPLGMEPIYDPIASSTNIPIMLYQAGKHGNRWQLDKTIEQLQGGGAEVYHKILPGVTGVFYQNDTAAETSAVLKALPAEIPRIVSMLAGVPTPSRAPQLRSNIAAHGNHSLDITLKPFGGEMEPLAIELRDIDGVLYKRSAFTGRVTLINFWASWCGPCVEEIPALNKLREYMKGKPFELISINYAESPQQIREFLDRVKVDFPVLLDTDGSYSAKWQVLVYPATFVIAGDGKIAYGVNGAIDWYSDDVLNKLEALMQHLVNN